MKYKKGSIALHTERDLHFEETMRKEAEKKKKRQHTCHLCGGVALNEDYKLRPGVFICAACYDRIFVQKRAVFDEQNKI